MKKTALVTHLLICACLLNSCYTKYDCPGYPETSFFSWFPYSKGQRFIFKNSAGLADTLNIGKATKTEPYTGRSYKGKSDPDATKCSAGANIVSSDYTPSTRLILDISHTATAESTNIGFAFDRMIFACQNIADTGLLMSTEPGAKLHAHTVFDLNVHGRIFPRVQVIETEDSAYATKSKKDKLYLAKGFGIVGYETYPEKEAWWIQ